MMVPLTEMETQRVEKQVESEISSQYLWEHSG